MQENQSEKIDGYISETGTNYDGVYNQDESNFSKDFLTDEHTDGFN